MELEKCPLPGTETGAWSELCSPVVEIISSYSVEIQGFVEAPVSAEMFFWHFQTLCSPHGCLQRNGMFGKTNSLRFCSVSGIDLLPCMTSGWGFLSLAHIPLWNSPSGIKREPQSKTAADDTGSIFFASLLIR